MQEKRCSPAETKLNTTVYSPAAENAREQAKAHPDRYPSNSDSIGIELVGMAFAVPNKKEPEFEAVTLEQNASLKWLIQELQATFNLSLYEVFRHPVVSRKNETEARSAIW